MASSATYVCSVLFRTLLPLALLAATIVRFNALSFVYGILLLLAPNIASPSSASMSGQTAGFMIAVITWSTIAMFAQVIFQTVLLVEATDAQPYGTILPNCTLLENVLRQLGLQRLEPNDILNIIRIIVPDIGMFIVALTVFLICRKLIPKTPPPFSDISPISLRRRVVQHTTLLVNVASMVLLVLLLGFSGIAYPSVLSSVYFFSFIIIATIWACYKTLGKRFAGFRIVLMVYSGAHLLLIYLYQFQFFQDVLAPKTFIARLMGLTAVIKTECRKPWTVKFHEDVLWPEFVSPAVILLLYFMLACQTRQYRQLVQEVDATLTRLKESPSKGRRGIRDRLRRSGGSERQSLVAQDENAQNYNTITPSADQPGASSDGVVNEAAEDEAGGGSRRNTAVSERLDSFLDSGPRERSAVASVFAYMMKQSYAGALIMMMAWSITYHSWLTFVLLLVACIIWMIPKKRKACLMISPVIVFYAVCLVIIQYVYGLNLTEEELPTETSSGYKFKEIGLIKHDYPCIPLAVQLLFTCVLWLTLRQFMRDRHLKAQEAENQGIPLETSERTDLQRAKEYLRNLDTIEGEDSETVKSIGRWWWTVFSKYWIVVCAILFLVMAVQEAVIYRIIYMIFFLYFLITFKVAYGFWRMTIYVFWWVVIVYSMLVLCIIYTYQFDQFPAYWQNSTGLSEQLLADIGLQQFNTATLFLKLLTPTSFLIVIILQLHYFQKHFLRFSDIKRFTRTYTEVLPDDDVLDHDRSPPIMGPRDTPVTSPPLSDEEGEGTAPSRRPEMSPSASQRSVTIQNPQYEEDGAPAAPAAEQGTSGAQARDEREYERRSTRSSISVHKKTCCDSLCETLKRWWDKGAAIFHDIEPLLWRVAEVHFFKVVVFTLFVCCVVEVSGINWVFIVIIAVCLPIPWFHSLMSYTALFWCGIAIIAKMFYQLETIHHDYWMSNCTDDNGTGLLPYPPWNESIDNAAYLGLMKTDDLTSYLRNYIAMLVVLALEGIIRVHQAQYYNKPTVDRPKQGIIFPDIKRPDADRGLLSCAKFFANYFFFKFGLELCYMMTVITMAVRLDIYSLIYGLFLGILLLMNRRLNFYFWPVYIIILAVLLVLQYLSSLGLPPGTCWSYPWMSSDNPTHMSIPVNLGLFLYLPSYTDSPDPIKLLPDFFQLLFVCMQWRVFYIEHKGNADDYGGGDNKDIIEDVEANAENPVEDFITVKDSYLDYIKVGLFYHFFWVSLVMIFIAGTTRISLFCMGYLVAVFFFLWFGLELLSLPLRRLVRLWHILQGYNYFVLMCKCALQLVGCVYIDKLQDLCWLKQLLSIICIKSEQYVGIPSTPGCTVADDQAGLAWDLVCFIILLLQIRIFKSHYFRHVVLELYVTDKLASRGAELINRNLINGVEMQKKKEQEVLQAVVRKMERLKLRQERLHQKTTLYSDDHYVVIRSGDYYMFEDDSDDETESTIDPDAVGIEDGKDAEAGDKVGPLEILNTAFTGGTKEALEKVRRQSTITRSASESKSDTDEPGRDHADSTSTAGRRSRQVSMISQPESPGTSADVVVADGVPPDDDDQYEDIDQEQVDEAVKSGSKHRRSESKTLCTKIMNYLRLLWAIIGGAMDSLTSMLRGVSRNYTAVATILDHEKDLEKKRIKEGRPVDEVEITDEITGTAYSKSPKANRLTLAVQTLAPATDDSMDPDFDPRDAEKEFEKSTPRIFQLLLAAFNALIARSDMLCYFAMILNHMVSASLLSMPYPFSVFLWAMLSVPRPTKTYWVTIITYTEAVVVVKYLFQFGFFPWNDAKTINNDAFWPPNIIGIEKKDNYAAYDLFLLVCLFIHRTFLKRNGLWKDTADADADLAHAENKEALSRTGSPLASPTHPEPLSEGSITMDLGSVHGDQSPDHGGNFPYDSGEHELEYSTSGEHTTDAMVAADEKKKKKKKKAGMCGACWRPFREFYKQMVNPRFNAATDVYAVMFLCDFINFFIIVFGYKSFGPSTAESATTVVTAVIKENKVPTPFLVMLLLQFVLIIIDRGIYLRKMVVGKFLYQILLLILIHVWMFFILPLITHREFSDNIGAQLWYFLKCIYFGLSAYQIRCGYPTRILGNFLTKKYNYLNLFLFKGFLIVPFLLELRALMDWMWTDTTLALTGWLEMEDIYANIFQLKCWRTSEDRYPTPRGEKKKSLIKYGVGGLLLFVLIFIIWFPLLLFSLADTVLYEPNPPIDCTVQIKLGGYQPVFQMSAQQAQSLQNMTEGGYASFLGSFSNNPEAQSFINSYKPEDITIVKLNGESTAVWGISPPSETSLAEDLNGTSSINLYFSLSFTRTPTSGAMETVSTQITTELSPNNDKDMAIRKGFAALIEGISTKPVEMHGIFPKYVQVPANSVPVPVPSLSQGQQTNTSFDLNSDQSTQWWQLKEETAKDPLAPQKDITELEYLTIVAFNDRVAPSALSLFTGYGIIGLYVSVVIVIGQFVRIFFSGLSPQIMFNELPNVDKVLKLCLDIYMVREAMELALEEELFAKLLFLYRSPETLIKWTKHKTD